MNSDAGGGASDRVQAIPFRAKSELVYETLRRAILSGELQPGQRVDQASLAAQLAVSRMPLRQALLRLADDGFLIVAPHRSAIVAPLSERDMAEVYDMRISLESMLAAVASERAEAQKCEELADLIEQQRLAVAAQDLRGFVDLDRGFHRSLYEVTGYAFACEMVERLRDRSDRYIHFYASHGHGAEESLAEHRQLLDAFRSRSADDLRRLTEAHIDRGRRTVAALVRHANENAHESAPLDPSAAVSGAKQVRAPQGDTPHESGREN